MLGVGVTDVSISGEGTIDGDHVFDPDGEEKMRGPHTILFGESRNLTIAGITITHAANYAFLAFDIENATFHNLTFLEGWDGIHIRGGRNMLVRNCTFYTGDDAIAGGYWENMEITDCHINSACNGIRMIMPASRLTIANCSFEGPGRFTHRTSRERKRNNMLSGILLQPGGWGAAPGKMEDIHIHDISMKNLDTPLMFVLNAGNEADHIVVERMEASAINKSACSVESWKGGSFGTLVFRDVVIEYRGQDTPGLSDLAVGQPHVDSRELPCWGWFARNVKQLVFENVELKYTGAEVRPAFRFDNVGNITFDKVKCKPVPGVESMVMLNSGVVNGKVTALPD
jgi:polygalacturonase